MVKKKSHFLKGGFERVKRLEVKWFLLSGREKESKKSIFGSVSLFFCVLFHKG